MNTLFLLMARHDARAIIPLETIQRDYFPHLSLVKLMGKMQAGEIALPLVRTEPSQKAMRGVHIADLASYLDRRREAAQDDLRKMWGPSACAL